MSRVSDNFYNNGSLDDGYDYEHQAWVKNGKYVRCGHPEEMECSCFGRLYEGWTVQMIKGFEAEGLDPNAIQDFF